MYFGYYFNYLVYIYEVLWILKFILVDIFYVIKFISLYKCLFDFLIFFFVVVFY